MQERCQETGSLSREQETNVSLAGGGRQGGYVVNPEKFVVFFCVFVFEYTGFFPCDFQVLQSFCISEIIFFPVKGKFHIFLTSSLTH